MATQKFVAGIAGLTYQTSSFGSELNSLVNGNAVLGSLQLDNSSNLDLFADFSISLGSVTTGAGAPYIGLYLYPLNEDGSTYGDGAFGTSAAGPPPSAYYIGSIPCQVSATGVIVGTLRGVLLPPGKFKLVLYNQAGVTLAASANNVLYRTYDFAVN